VLQITIVILVANSYAENLIQEIHDNLTYEAVPTDLMRKIENKVKKLANEMFKQGSITKDMKHYLVNSDVKIGNITGESKSA
jgi:polyhydroxyalkanoate synthesis regulator phasin